MSVVVRRSDLSEEHVNIIRSLLYFQPKKKFNFSGKRGTSAAKPIFFYQIVESGGDQYVFLPYRFAAILFNKNLNAEISYTPSQFRFTGTLRDYQSEDAPIILNQLKEYGTSTLRLYPSYGKTIVGAYMAAHFGFLTIVLMHRTTLLKQWQQTFQKVTNASTWVVEEEPMPPLFNVIICLDKRVEKVPLTIRNRVGMMIIDEAHAFCTESQVERLLGFHPRYVIAETATLERDDDMHRMIVAICGEHHISREMKKKFHVYKIFTGIKGEREERKHGPGVVWHVLAKSLAFNSLRNQIIVELAMKNPSYKIVILTGYRTHTKLLYQMFLDLGESVDFLCGPKKNYSDSRILIGTINKIGTGFDEASFCDDFKGVKINLGILVHSVAKKQLLEQTVGRVFRADFPNIMHLVDDDKTIENHWRKAKTWYKSKGGEIKEINLQESGE